MGGKMTTFEAKQYLRSYLKRVIKEFPEMILPTDYKVRVEDLGKRLKMADESEWDIVLVVRAQKVN